ncbi:hypothetical protein GCK72_024446 [Caenorhabditis remanei]|uniref:STAS domain-containing protein n=1 Tax=Caenorhabditis remanei TaxID=31234 RepID=A0A6A5G088_CAERE|nr:hypothetical protein GCK72_024446 [Caenorhabditis remanei]KAF1747979.1 hypothetical protein GCK72_024446 [Caenorhabditis remanei]
MNQQQYDELHGYRRQDGENWVKRKVKNFGLVFTRNGCKKAVKRRLPILDWSSRYHKSQLSADIFAGVTTGIYNVPQAMSYSTLAGLPPVHGLYASFFSPIFYAIFGSSPTSSIGVFSITCLMVNNCIEKMQHGDNAIRFPGLTSIEIITSLCLLTGLFQTIMSVFRFNKAMLLLPESSVSAITFSACFFGIVNQIPKIFGFSVPHRNEFMFSLFHSMYDIAVHIPKLNEWTTLLSAGSLIYLIVSQMLFEPLFKKICKKFPFPRDLILMTLAITISYFLNLDAKYGVQTLRTVPRGFPHFGIPRIDLWIVIWYDAASIAIVAYSVTIAMGRMYASELKYRLDTNQELLALGITNFGSSFFPVFPTSCSLSRTVVNKDSGARSQLSGIVSALIILGVIEFFGVFLEPLPKCVLATIVVFVVRSLLKKCSELPYFWRCSINDFWIWIVTAIVTLCTDIAPGVFVGMAFALLTLAIPFLQPTTKRLGQIGEHDFKAKTHYQSAKETPFPIIRFDAPLIFCNAEKFTDMINDEISEKRENAANGSLEGWTAIILDCHTWTYTDSMGMDAVKEANDCLHRFNAILLFANLKSSVRRQYRAAGLIEERPIDEEDLEKEEKRIEQEESRIQEEKKTLSSVSMKMNRNKNKCAEANVESGGHDDEDISHIEIKISQDQKQLAEDEKKLVQDKKTLVQVRNELKMKQKKLKEFNKLSPEDQEKKRNEEVKKISYNQIYPSIQDALHAAPELITKQQELFDIKKSK